MNKTNNRQEINSVQYIQITSQQSGQKILSFLSRFLPDIPLSALHRAIRRGEIRINGKRCTPFLRIANRDTIRIPPFTTQKQNNLPQSPFFLEILHTTPDFFLINKPTNLAVHGGTGNTISIISQLRSQFPEESFQSTPIHRLDKHTSGLLLVARSYIFLQKMQQLWQNNQVEKKYLAWVQGSWTFPQNIILQDEIQKQTIGKKEKMQTGQGKIAQCQVNCLKQEQNRSLLIITLKTGRTHQIRVQLAAHGFPIIGDGKYGIHAKQMFLHAVSLAWEGQQFHCLPQWEDEYLPPNIFLKRNQQKIIASL